VLSERIEKVAKLIINDAKVHSIAPNDFSHDHEDEMAAFTITQ
jgi:hypothetical protein